MKPRITVVTRNNEFKERIKFLLEEHNNNNLSIVDNPLEDCLPIVDTNILIINVNSLMDNLIIQQALGMCIAKNELNSDYYGMEEMYLIAVDEPNKCRLSIKEDILNRYGVSVGDMESLINAVAEFAIQANVPYRDRYIKS